MDDYRSAILLVFGTWRIDDLVLSVLLEIGLGTSHIAQLAGMMGTPVAVSCLFVGSTAHRTRTPHAAMALGYLDDGREPWSFKGTRWQQISNAYRTRYLKNACSVLLTLARQGFSVYLFRQSDQFVCFPLFSYCPSIGART